MKRMSQLLLFLSVIFSTASQAVTSVTLAQQPLLTAALEPPNIMFMVDDSGSMDTTVPNSGGMSRLEVAQQTVNNLLQNLTGVRVGLSTFSGTDARILVGINNISSNLSTMINAVNNLQSTENTPLAHTQLDLGRYFVQGYNNTLTLHPGQSNQSTKSAYNIFNDTPIYAKNVSAASPIQYYCQQSFIILLTDGEPYNDIQPAASTGLSDYVYTPATCPVSPTFANPSLTCGLANVAAAMYDMDLRPDLTDPTGAAKKNNVETFTIGFGGLSTEGNALLEATAQNAGGAFLQADDTDTLIQALESATSSILYQSVTASSISFNGSTLTTTSAIYQPQYTTTYWSGSLFKIPIAINGTLGSAIWDAGVLLSQAVYQNRLVFTYNNDSNLNAPRLFQTLANLAAAQRIDLNTGTTGASDSNGQLRINYLLGDRSNERTTANQTKLFRQRSSVLGDIVDSAPVYVGTAQANWPNVAPFPTTSGQTYSTFKAGLAATRTPMVYVGANDGMLHGFNANTGQEVMAYVPLSLSNDFNTALQTAQGITLSASAAIPLGLHYYTNPDYAHRFYVDGTPAIQDAYFQGRGSSSAAWHTVLIGGERAGGKGYYALDVTNPANFTPANFTNTVLWEFSNANNTDLGNTYSDPQIGLMNNGRWAAIFGNGYNATGTNNATLFIVFLDGGLDGVWTKGTDYIEIDTKSGVATQNNTPNGLATPAVVDIDGNGTIDRIYAGDLNGDIWAFNVSSSTTSNWGTAYGTSSAPVPLYNGIATQPITTQPVVANNPATTLTSANTPDLLVMVGTGQYLGSTDQANTATQGFYGVWDAGTGNISQSQLVRQTYSSSGSNRIMSENSVSYSTKKGWYISFTGGERIVLPASVFQTRINSNQFESEVAFSTFIPNTSTPCSYGGTGYFMIVQVANGGQPSSAILDINNNNQIDTTDNIGGNVVSGIQFTSAVPSQPVIRGDYLFIPSSNGTLQKILIATTGLPTGRLSWAILKQT